MTVKKDDKPDVIDGEFTPWFFERVAALDAQAQRKVWELPKCSRCQRPLCCGQVFTHHSCVDGAS